jgi:hypothetical protein
MNLMYIVLYLDDTTPAFPRVVGVPQRELVLAQRVAKEDFEELLGESYDALDWEECNDHKGHYWTTVQDLIAYAIYEVAI